MFTQNELVERQNELVERLQADLERGGQQKQTQEQGHAKEEEETSFPEDSTDITTLKKLTVPVLREALKARGENASGKKVSVCNFLFRTVSACFISLWVPTLQDDLIHRFVELDRKQEGTWGEEGGGDTEGNDDKSTQNKRRKLGTTVGSDFHHVSNAAEVVAGASDTFRTPVAIAPTSIARGVNHLETV